MAGPSKPLIDGLFSGGKKPTARTLAESWDTYRRAVIPPGTSTTGIRNNQFAFYGGASYVLDTFLALSDDALSEDAAVAWLARLREELELFARQEAARVTPGD